MFHRAYQNTPEDFRLVRQFLSDCVRLTGRVTGWSFCRFEHWIHRLNHETLLLEPDFLRQNCELFLEWDHLLGLAISEEGSDAHVLVHPHEPEMAARIYRWLELHWPEQHQKTHAAAQDTERAQLLSSLGYHLQGEAEYLYCYPVPEVPLVPHLPAGYRFSSFPEDQDETRRADLINRAFGVHHSADRYRSSRQAPSYRADLDLCVVSPSGAFVAFCMGWVDEELKMAELEPLGTDPDHLRQGLGRAVVMEAFRRLQDHRVHRVLISSGAEPAVSNRLYESLGPSEKWVFHAYVKP